MYIDEDEEIIGRVIEIENQRVVPQIKISIDLKTRDLSYR